MHRVWHEKLIYVEWQWWSWISAAALGTGALAGVRMSRNTYLEVPQQPQCRVELHTSRTHYLWQHTFFGKKISLACLLQIRLSSTIFFCKESVFRTDHIFVNDKKKTGFFTCKKGRSPCLQMVWTSQSSEEVNCTAQRSRLPLYLKTVVLPY